MLKIFHLGVEVCLCTRFNVLSVLLNLLCFFPQSFLCFLKLLHQLLHFLFLLLELISCLLQYIIHSIGFHECRNLHFKTLIFLPQGTHFVFKLFIFLWVLATYLELVHQICFSLKQLLCFRLIQLFWQKLSFFFDIKLLIEQVLNLLIS